MKKRAYHLTPTVVSQVKDIVRDTKYKWGVRQSRKYYSELLSGFQYIAENHESLHSPHRRKLAEGTSFSIHLVERHYVAFQVHDKYNIIIAGIFHESMDIPVHLQELQCLSDQEIKALQKLIEKSPYKQPK